MFKAILKKYFILLVFVIACNNSACNNSDHHMPLLDVHGNTQQGQGSTGGIGPYFLNDIMSVINTNCMPCHGAGSALDWTNYSSFKSKKTQIEQRVLGPFANMPIKRPLSEESKQILQKWIDAGMPFAQENIPVPGPIQPVPVPQFYTYEIDILPIIKLYCILCHNESSGGRIRNWLKYEIAFEFKEAMRTKMVEKSMPLKGANIQMPDEARDVIIKWIDQGAIRAP